MRNRVVLAAAILLCCAGAADAFPGRNGVIAITRTGVKPQATLVVVDPATGAERELGVGTEPAWSADGAKLAFVRDSVVYVGAADGSDPAAVGPGDYPTWSPDGTKLAVSRPDDRGVRQLYVLDLDGNATQLTSGTADVSLPAWSPTGSTIAFATGDSLQAIAADGTEQRTIPTAGARMNGGPAWSPDGATLAFVDARGQVWTVAPDGGGAHQVTYTLVGPSGAAARPAWSPDGRSIAWTVNADLCVTDLAGSVRRLTRTQQSTPALLASYPDWQPSATGSETLSDPPRGANDSVGCDWNPGVRVELTSLAPTPAAPVVKSPQQVVFVNHTTVPLTVATTMKGKRGVIEAGGFLGFDTEPGDYEFTVTGYPDGAARRGTFLVPAAGAVAISQHAPLRYGDRTVLSGTAEGPAGSVTLWAKPAGATQAVQMASVRPTSGRWQVSVAPRISTTYEARFQGATTLRLLRVMPALTSRRSGNTVTVRLRPAAGVARQPVYLFRLTGRTWTGARTARLSSAGTAVFRKLAPGRYYVGFEGGDRYWSTAGEPFTVRS